MYDSSNNIEEEKNYSDEDLFLGSKITMLMRTRDINNNWQARRTGEILLLILILKRLFFLERS